MTKLSAGIIVIGNEVLSGRTQDTNSNFIAKNLIESGIELMQIIVIQDNEEIIIDTVRNFSNKYTYVFTTGGIGPTHDDITSESLAKAFNTKYDFHPEAYKILENYYPVGEFNEGRKKMAKMPIGVKLIHNPITSAPGFKILNVFVLPGVPEIMKKMFLRVMDKIEKGSPKKIVTINTNLYESTISITLSEIQNKYNTCTIGSYPYFNFAKKKAGVNIVISSWTMQSLDDIIFDIEKMITLKGGKSSIV